MKRGTGLLLLALLLAGCARAPRREVAHLGIETPERWMAAESTGQPGVTDWWVAFGDADLDTVVQEALRSNRDLRAAAARLDAAAAEARIAGADLLPSASIGLQASRRRQNIIGIPIPGFGDGVISTRSTSIGVSLDTRWEFDLWGRIRAGKSAALADLQASWADLAASSLSIAGQTAKAWFALSEAQLQVELAEETVESYRLSADRIRRRYEEGLRPPLDLRLALSNLATAEALLEQRREQRDRVARQLEILLGRYPSGRIDAEHDLPDLAIEVPGGLPSTLLIRRPDLVAAERRAAAAGARVAQSRRALLPQISLTASGGTLSEELENLLDGDYKIWSIAGGLLQPLFQGGRLRANVARSEALEEQALAVYAASVLRAFGEVETALFSEETLARREAQITIAAEQSEAARSLAERQYAAGLVDYITVLETQRRALGARSEELAVRRLRLEARVNLHLALGGGFSLEREWVSYLAEDVTPGTEASVER